MTTEIDKWKRGFETYESAYKEMYDENTELKKRIEELEKEIEVNKQPTLLPADGESHKWVEKKNFTHCKGCKVSDAGICGQCY